MKKKRVSNLLAITAGVFLILMPIVAPSASYEEVIQRVLELSKENIDIESDLAKSIIKQGISADVSILQLRMKVLFGATLLIVFGIVGIRK
jgi:hypothetical protein